LNSTAGTVRCWPNPPQHILVAGEAKCWPARYTRKGAVRELCLLVFSVANPSQHILVAQTLYFGLLMATSAVYYRNPLPETVAWAAVGTVDCSLDDKLDVQ
jgi:hypothetical protein